MGYLAAVSGGLVAANVLVGRIEWLADGRRRRNKGAPLDDGAHYVLGVANSRAQGAIVAKCSGLILSSSLCLYFLSLLALW